MFYTRFVLLIIPIMLSHLNATHLNPLLHRQRGNFTILAHLMLLIALFISHTIPPILEACGGENTHNYGYIFNEMLWKTHHHLLWLSEMMYKTTKKLIPNKILYLTNSIEHRALQNTWNSLFSLIHGLHHCIKQQNNWFKIKSDTSPIIELSIKTLCELSTWKICSSLFDYQQGLKVKSILGISNFSLTLLKWR